MFAKSKLNCMIEFTFNAERGILVFWIGKHMTDKNVVCDFLQNNCKGVANDCHGIYVMGHIIRKKRILN